MILLLVCVSCSHDIHNQETLFLVHANSMASLKKQEPLCQGHKKRSRRRKMPLSRVQLTATFKKRNTTLMRKAQQLHTLCDVPVCLICFGPDGRVCTWPENRTDVEKAINAYRNCDAIRKEESLLGLMLSRGKKFEEKKYNTKETNFDALIQTASGWIDDLSSSKDAPALIEFLQKLSSCMWIVQEKGQAAAASVFHRPIIQSMNEFGDPLPGEGSGEEPKTSQEQPDFIDGDDGLDMLNEYAKLGSWSGGIFVDGVESYEKHEYSSNEEFSKVINECFDYPLPWEKNDSLPNFNYN